MSPILGIYASQISGHLFTLAGNYDSLATVTVPSGGLSSITFDGIPTTGYSHLQIRQIARTTVASTVVGGNGIRFNSDTASNYATHQLIGNGASADAFAYVPDNYIYYSLNTGSSAGSNIFGVAVIDILDYSSTSKFKTVRTLAGADLNGSGQVGIRSGLWRSTSAINTITIDARDSSSFVEYSQFALYGVKA